jgi:spore germination protein YaaH
MSVRGVERGLLLAGIALLLLCGPVSAWGAGGARGAPGAQGPTKMQAFLLAGAPDSFADLQAHAASIGTVYPTYYECEPGSGSIEGHDEPAIDAFAQAHHIPLLPRFNCQNGPTVHALLTEPALRGQTLAGLVALARNPAYAGLSLDLENDGAEDRTALSTFVATLAARLHATHRKLTVVVDGVPREEPRHATYLYDYAALSAAADHVFVLGWGAHWEGSAPGPIAPLPWVQGVVAHIAALPTARRFVLGEPLYGLDWATGGQAGGQAIALQFSGVAALVHQFAVKPLLDRAADELTFVYQRAGVIHRVWYLDARTILDRLRIARAGGLAIGVWRLGEEDQALWAGTF